MWRKRSIRSSSALLVVALASALAAPAGAAEYFPRDLKLGDEGLDVLNLQVALNAAADTRVATSGAGSPGSETRHFGARTEAALARYQAARGLSPADGVANAATRAELNRTLAALVGGAPIVAATGLGERLVAAREEFERIARPSVSGAPVVFAGISSSAEAGAAASLYGYNFAAGEEYRIVVASTSKPFAAARATTSIALDFKAPRLKVGTYALYVEGSNGRSGEFDFVLGSRSRPRITSVTPTTIARGDEVTIYGQRFGREGAQVITPFGAVENATQKSGRIEFVSDLGPDFQVPGLPAAATTTIPVSIRVQTSKGVSDPFLVYVTL